MSKTGNETLGDLFARWKTRDRDLEDYVDELRLKRTPSADIARAVDERFGRSGHWPEALVRPIANALTESGAFARVEVLGPFGIGCNIALHAYEASDDNEPAATLTLRPNLSPEDAEGCLEWVNYAEDNGQFEPGTIGHLNDLHRPTVTIPMDTRIGDVEYWKGLMSPID